MKRKATTQATPRKKPKLVRQNASLINPPRRKSLTPEKKNTDVAGLTDVIVAAQTTAVVQLLNGIDDGTTSTTRIGRRCNLSSLTYNIAGSFASTTVGSSPIRLVIVYDRQPAGALAATTTVFTQDNIATTMNLANSKRFTVLVDDKTAQLSSAGPGAFFIDGFRKLNLDMEFNDNSTSTITSIEEGAIIAFVWQNGNIITANPKTLFTSRIRFTDV